MHQTSLKLSFFGILLSVLSWGVVSSIPSTAWAGKKGLESVMIVYDPQLKTSSLKAVGVGFPPKNQALTPAQRRLMAIRAATVVGYRHLLQASLQLKPVLPVGTFHEEINGFLQGAQRVQTRTYADGKAEVELILPLGSVAESLQATQTLFIQTGLPICEIDRKVHVISEEEVIQTRSQ